MSVHPASAVVAVAAVHPVVLLKLVKVFVTSLQSPEPKVVASALTSVPRSLAVARVQFVLSALGAEFPAFAFRVPAEVFL